MLRVLAGTDQNELLLHDNIVQALPEIGAAAIALSSGRRAAAFGSADQPTIALSFRIRP
jgi:hypothetical protein